MWDHVNVHDGDDIRYVIVIERGKEWEVENGVAGGGGRGVAIR